MKNPQNCQFVVVVQLVHDFGTTNLRLEEIFALVILPLNTNQIAKVPKENFKMRSVIRASTRFVTYSQWDSSLSSP